jgi:putative endonuclease
VKYFVYILRTSGNTLYTGQTSDLKKRLKQHRDKKIGAKYLRRFDSVELVYCEKSKNRSEAMKREAEIKKMTKMKKEKLVWGYNKQCL